MFPITTFLFNSDKYKSPDASNPRFPWQWQLSWDLFEEALVTPPRVHRRHLSRQLAAVGPVDETWGGHCTGARRIFCCTENPRAIRQAPTTRWARPADPPLSICGRRQLSHFWRSSSCSAATSKDPIRHAPYARHRQRTDPLGSNCCDSIHYHFLAEKFVCSILFSFAKVHYDWSIELESTFKYCVKQ